MRRLAALVSVLALPFAYVCTMAAGMVVFSRPTPQDSGGFAFSLAYLYTTIWLLGILLPIIAVSGWWTHGVERVWTIFMVLTLVAAASVESWLPGTWSATAPLLAAACAFAVSNYWGSWRGGTPDPPTTGSDAFNGSTKV